MRISLYGIVDAAMSRKVAELLDSVSADEKQLDLRINTPGGSVAEGWAIYNRIKESGLKVTATIDGVAASIGMLFVAAAGKVRMAKGSRLMVHRPYTPRGGTSAELRAKADSLDGMQENYEDALASKSTLSRPHLRAMIEKETWLTAEQALTAGFADELIDTPAIPLAMACADPGYTVPEFAQELYGLAESPETKGAEVPEEKKTDSGAVQFTPELVKQYRQEFGDENGLQWATDLKPLAECYQLAYEAEKASSQARMDAAQQAHDAEKQKLEGELQQLRDENKKLTDAAAMRGESEPVSLVEDPEQQNSSGEHEKLGAYGMLMKNRNN